MPAIAISIPRIFLHSNGCCIVPNIPKSSITYATINWEMTISIAAFAGPSAPMLWITVIVINAPITPPRSVYLLSTCHNAETLCLPVNIHASTQTINAESCTHPVDTHKLVCFVTYVLKTPWILISAPEINAVKNPHIMQPPLSSDDFPVAVCKFYYQLMQKICFLYREPLQKITSIMPLHSCCEMRRKNPAASYATGSWKWYFFHYIMHYLMLTTL